MFTKSVIYFIINIPILIQSFSEYSSFAFVIDNTKSMKDDIEQVRLSAKKLFTVISSSKRISNYILVSVNDPETEMLLDTTNQEEYMFELNKLNVTNGNKDCPEMAMNGIKMALDQSKPGCYVYVFTDAAAKDYDIFNEVKALSQKKQCQVVFALTGVCRNDYEAENYMVYHNMAEATCGQVFHLEKKELNQIMNYLIYTISSRKNVITYKKFTESGNHTIKFNVDKEMTDIAVSASGKDINVTVFKSDGSLAGVETIVKTKDISVVKLIDPEPGDYTVKVFSTRRSSIVVTASTHISFQHGFSILKPSSLTDTVTRPLPDENSYLSIKLSENAENVEVKTVQLLDTAENILKELPIIRTDLTEKFSFTSPFRPPTVMFKIAINGYDKERKITVRRISSTFVETQSITGTIEKKNPKVTIEGKTEVDAEYEKPLELKCKVYAFPEPSIVWQEDYEPLPSTTTTIELPYDFISILKINTVTKNATYTCIASNTEGENIGTVQVKTYPKTFFNVLEVPKDTNIEYEKKGILRCKVDSQPPATINWFRNEEKLINNEHIEISPDGTLTVNSMVPSLAGYLRCEATNDLLTRTFYAKLSISGLEAPVINKETKVIYVMKGSAKDISCRVTQGKPKPTLVWKFKDKFLGSEETINLEHVDIKDGGTYTCSAENEVGKDSHEIKLVVKYAAKIEGLKTNTTMRVPVGQTVELLCNAEGFPKPDLQWVFSSTDISKAALTSSASDSSGKKILTNLKPQDEGSYKCVASNEHGTADITYHVQVLDIPVIEKKIKIITVRKGQDINIICRIMKGKPEPKITWKFQGKFHATGHTIHIAHVDVKDGGSYVCEAENEIGQDTHDIELIVKYKPVIDKGTKVIHVTKGQDIDINCRTMEGKPEPKVTWKFQGKFFATGHTIHLTHVDAKDGGSYVCEAENEIGQDTHDIELIVKYKPVIDKGTKVVHVTKGQDIYINCSIMEGKPEPKVTWKFQGKFFATGHTIHLTHVDAKDGGSYVCEAENEIGQDTHDIELIVKYKPVIDKGTKVVHVTKGQDIDINCSIMEGKPEPKVTWKFQGKFFATGHTIHLTHVDAKDGGSYVCEAENEIGQDTHDIELIVKYKPVIDKGTKVVHVTKGQDIDINCSIMEGKPEPKVTWKFQGKFFATGHTIHLTHVDAKDGGSYVCEAENEIGQDTHDIELIVKYKPVIDKGTKVVHVTKGQDIDINCSIMEGKPEPKVTWKFQGKFFATGHTIHLTHVDAKDGGSYVCEAENEIGQDTHDIELIVKYKPVIDKGTKVVHVTKGQDIDINCSIMEGKPEPKVTWKFQGKFFATGHTIHLTHVDAKDGGSYVCEAENEIGQDTHDIELIVKYKPVIDKGTKVVHVTKGQDIYINCRIMEGKPEPKVTWKFQGKFFATGHTIHLTHVDVKDGGSYVCEAENEIGQDTHDIELIVKYKPVIDKGTKVVHVTKGQDIDINCSIMEGKPEPKVTWKFQGKFFATGHTIHLTHVDAKDGGSYVCEAENEIGQDTHDIELIVKYKPVIDKGTKVVHVTKGQDIYINCRIMEGKPEPKVTWKFQGKFFATGHTIHLTHVDVKDGGSYVCEAENEIGQDTHDIELIVKYKPVIDKGTKVVHVTKGQDIDINCRIMEGKPEPKVTWKFQGKFFATGHTIHLTHVDVKDGGSYVCEAENENGQETHDIELIVKYKPVIDKGTKVVHVTKGQDIDINCSIMEGKPEPKVTWKFQGKFFATGHTIHLTHVDVKDGGSYVCEAENEIGQDTHDIELIVKYKPVIDKGTKVVHVTKGQDIDINCRIMEGKPEPKVTWKFQGKFFTTRHTIHLTHVDVKDGGSYVCEAKNEIGQDTHDIELIVKLPLLPPVIDKRETLLEKIVNTKVKIKCSVITGNPKSTIRWLFKSNKIGSRKEILSQTSDVLSFRVSLNDVGTYTCIATNGVGSDSHDVYLIVHYPPLIKSGDEKALKAVNEVVTLMCVVTGFPKPNVVWYFKDKPVERNEKYSIYKDNSLRFTAESADTGPYSCKAKNNIGEKTKRITLTIYVPVNIKTPKKYLIEIKEGEKLTLKCNATGNPKPTINWLFNNGDSTKSVSSLKSGKKVFPAIRFNESGVYTCIASNVGSSKNISYNVTVLVPPEIISADITELEMFDGDLYLIIPCIHVGFPKPTIAWIRDGYPLPWQIAESDGYGYDNDSLIIKTVDKSPREYTCIIKNIVNEVIHQIRVNYKASPEIGSLESMRSVNIEAGNGETLSCNIPHNHVDRVVWYKNGRKIGKGNLQLKDVTRKDAGVYTCRVMSFTRKPMNEHINVVVGYKPAFREDVDNIYHINEDRGSTVTLLCRAIGHPEPEINWWHNGNQISYKGMDYKVILEESNAGTYVCFVQNIFGNITRPFEIVN